MLKVVIRPHARNDIKKIWCYTFENWGEKQAANYTNSLEQAIKEIAVNPKVGTGIEHLRKDYRLYHIEHHFVIYRLTTKVIDVVRILGENMDVARHL